MTTKIDFNLTKQQQIKFNDIYKETEIKYPELLLDDISKMRVNVLIAHSILNDDNFDFETQKDYKERDIDYKKQQEIKDE